MRSNKNYCILCLLITDHPKNTSIMSPKRMKNPPYPANETSIPQRKSPTTFARFCSIFIGAAEALASICFSPLSSA